MKIKTKYILFFVALTTIAIVIACVNKENKETILTGKTSILVDESLLPIIEDQVAVFENEYEAKINLIPQSEKEAVISLTKNKADVIILPRQLTKDENNYFTQKKIVPRQTIFAKDAVALIRSKTNDTLIDVSEIISFLKGNPSKIKGLVFDNPNSSNSRYMANLAGLNTLPENGIFSFKTNKEVINYVSQNSGFIGVVGVNWIYQPPTDLIEVIHKIEVLYVKGINQNDYFYPSQENLVTNDYPLARDLYIINCQGFEGLGIGFASFISGEKGQRLILKSGLAPVRVPGRNIRTRKEIENKK